MGNAVKLRLDLAAADESDNNSIEPTIHKRKSPRRQFIVQPDYNSLTVTGSVWFIRIQRPSDSPSAMPEEVWRAITTGQPNIEPNNQA
jgi:hypothetical protein